MSETLPKPTSTPVVQRTATPTDERIAECNRSGRVEERTYPGVVARQDIPVRVYLPPCYPAPGVRYPAVYLLHGKPFDETHWDDLGADEVVDAGILSNAWPAFVLVMPLQPEPLFSNSDGGPWSYEREMIDGLLPFVEAAFLVDPRPESRAIAGISRGGIWALEIGFRNPTVFDAVAALSPSLAVNHARPEYDPMELASQIAPLPTDIFLTAGDDDWARQMTEELSVALAAAGHDNTLLVTPGSHDSSTWQAVLPQLFAFLAAGWE